MKTTNDLMACGVGEGLSIVGMKLVPQSSQQQNMRPHTKGKKPQNIRRNRK
jgi:hypothetical protein